jgi:hypothetical protein
MEGCTRHEGAFIEWEQRRHSERSEESLFHQFEPLNFDNVQNAVFAFLAAAFRGGRLRMNHLNVAPRHSSTQP